MSNHDVSHLIVEADDQIEAFRAICASRLSRHTIDSPAFPLGMLWLISAAKPELSRNNIMCFSADQQTTPSVMALTRDLILMIDFINARNNLGLSKAAIHRLMESHPLLQPPPEAHPTITQNTDGTRTVSDLICDGGKASDGPVG